MEYAHHVGFIDRGQLIGFDSPLGLKMTFAGGYRVRLLHDDPQVLAQAAEALRSVGYAIAPRSNGEVQLLLADGSKAQLDRLRHTLQTLDSRLDFTAALPSIEEVFAGMIRQRRSTPLAHARGSDLPSS